MNKLNNILLKLYLNGERGREREREKRGGLMCMVYIDDEAPRTNLKYIFFFNKIIPKLKHA
jgi:hypothetical protein